MQSTFQLSFLVRWVVSSRDLKVIGDALVTGALFDVLIP